MNFAQQQADPGRRIVGFGAVLLFHALLVYALVTGLAKKVVDVVRAPIETKVIEEIKKRVPIWKMEHYIDGTREWVDPTNASGVATK